MLASGKRPRSAALAHDDPISDTPPATFGPFRVLHQVGAGVLGPVYRAYDPSRDGLAAVKVFRLDLTPEQLRTLAGELQGLCEIGLDHPAIATPLAAGIEGGRLYLASEYVTGDSLDAALRIRATASLDEVRRVLAALGDALDYARARGVGHGALHPRDIFVGPDRVCATGFGIVQALERTGLAAPVRRPYAAPERVAGASWSTPADVFSLAVLAHEWLTGKRPAGSSRTVRLAGALAPAYVEEVESILRRALAEHADDRYRHARAFVQALEAAGPAPSEEARPAGPGEIPLEPTGVRRDAEELDLRLVDREVEEGSEAPGGEASAPLELALERAAEETPEASAGSPAASLLDLSEREGPEATGSAEMEAPPAEEAPGADTERVRGPRWQWPGEEAEAVASADREDGDVAVVADEDGAAVEMEAPRLTRFDREPYAAGLRTAGEQHVDAAFERPRIAIVPYAVVLMVGVLAGFLAGYGLGSRERAVSRGEPVATPAASPSGPVGGETGRSARPFTEAPVGGVGAAAGEAAVSTGRLLVRSWPAAAAVRVDGVLRGTTPLVLTGLGLGRYRIDVSRSGYVPAAREVTLTAEVPSRELMVSLEPVTTRAAPSGGVGSRAATGRRAAAATTGSRRPAGHASAGGTLVALSRPAGARVVLDGRTVGRTPLTLKDVAPGRHAVRLELDGYRVWTTEVVVASGRETRVAGSLDRLRVP
jgi:hypothetical protein